MDLHKTICTSAPARWKAIDGMIMTAGPRNCSKMCNHFVCCIRSLPALSCICILEVGYDKAGLFPILSHDFHLDLSHRCLFLECRTGCCMQGCFILNVMQMGPPGLARGELSAINKRLIARVNFRRLGI